MVGKRCAKSPQQSAGQITTCKRAAISCGDNKVDSTGHVNTEENDDPVDTLRVVLSQYELLRLILSQLNAAQLCRASRVCHAWRQTVEHILRRRRLTGADFVVCQQLNARSMRRFRDRRVAADDERQTSPNVAHKLLSSAVEQCWHEPHIVLVVSCDLRKRTQGGDAVSAEGVFCERSFAGRVPTHCHTVQMSSSSGCIAGRIGERGDVKELQDADHEDSSGGDAAPERLTGLLIIPRLDDSTAVVRVCRFKPRRNIEERLQGHFEPSVLDSLKAAILLYSCGKGARCAQRIARFLWQRCRGQLALAGGWVDRLKSSGESSVSLANSLVTLVYFGGSRVRTASLVVGDSACDSVGSLANGEVLDWSSACRLLLAEQSCMTGRVDGARCLVFLAACCGRGVHCQPPQRESQELSERLLPGTSVFGVYVNGELGVNYLPHRAKSSADSARKWRDCDDSTGDCFMLTYTTVALSIYLDCAGSRHS